ncbi:MAG: hypothetical protein K8T25_03545 [Planctomycetia bacterium]|nr:hypothetical protein [Planctomycetia bacterium]
MTTSPTPSPAPTSLARRPRRWLRRLGWTFAAAIGLLMVLALLFVVNGLWLANNETPVVGVTQPGAKALPPPADEHPDPAQVKVLSFNIAKGFVYKEGVSFDTVAHVTRRMDEIATLIRRERPDVVFLCETVFECGPCPVNQVEYLSRETGLRHWAFGEDYNFGLPFYRVVGGNAIL